MPDDILEINLWEILGAIKETFKQQLTLYIPYKDKDGKDVKNIHQWIKEAQRLLTVIGDGTTTMPPADGTWLKRDIDSMKDLKDDDILWEKTTMIFTYIDPDKFEKNLRSLREFWHRFGRETNQGEVVFEIAGEFFKIRKYDPK